MFLQTGLTEVKCPSSVWTWILSHAYIDTDTLEAHLCRFPIHPPVVTMSASSTWPSFAHNQKLFDVWLLSLNEIRGSPGRSTSVLAPRSLYYSQATPSYSPVDTPGWLLLGRPVPHLLQTSVVAMPWVLRCVTVLVLLACRGLENVPDELPAPLRPQGRP